MTQEHRVKVMSKMIRLKISGKGIDTDAPTVDDLLGQIRDYFDLLREVEKAIADDGVIAIEWRVVSASKNSPLDLGFEAFPRQYATNIDMRVAHVTRVAAEGLFMLQRDTERPPYFTDEVIKNAQRIFERVTNGLNGTELDFGDGLPTIEITPVGARSATENTKRVLKPPADKPYEELGSVEGTFQSVARERSGRPFLQIQHRLTGDLIKCTVSAKALTKIEHHEIGEIWRSKRLVVIGVIHYKGLGRISHVESTDVEFLPPRHELPDIDDIVDEDFTGGLRSDDYLERLRDGRLG